MNLKKLLSTTEIVEIKGVIDEIEIENVLISSRECKKNSLFIAQKGGVFDGHMFVDEAIINGAVAIVVEKEIPLYGIPQIIVKNSRIACSTIASQYYNNPKDKLKFVGITGTNGKTSSSLFMGKLLEQAKKKYAVFGTLGVFCNGEKIKTSLTTPDPLVFHKILADLVKKEIEFVVMEVSAHAIALQKVANIDYEVGIITNITQDHLDFFKTLKNYSSIKNSWVLSNRVKRAVVNVDDKLARIVISKRKNVLTYGLYNPCDVFAVDIQKKENETIFILNLLDNVFECRTNLVGEFNIYNIMAVATGALCIGIKFEDIISGIEKFVAPEGRFNVVKCENGVTLVVDFAHTPDGLEKALKTAREVCKGELISVFGCGGDRDKTKRSIMGEISESLADFTIITSDNPRFERPDLIMSDIEKGFQGINYIKIANREEAIKRGIKIAKRGDFVVICGKGGEKYQDLNGIKTPYSDEETIFKTLKLYNINVVSSQIGQIQELKELDEKELGKLNCSENCENNEKITNTRVS